MNINSIKKYEGAVWLIFILVLIFSEVFVIWEHPDYSTETASEKAINYDVLETETVEYGPEGMLFDVIATKWQDRETGKVYSLNDKASAEYRENQINRLILIPIWVCIGITVCLLFAFFRWINRSD